MVFSPLCLAPTKLAVFALWLVQTKIYLWWGPTDCSAQRFWWRSRSRCRPPLWPGSTSRSLWLPAAGRCRKPQYLRTDDDDKLDDFPSTNADIGSNTGPIKWWVVNLVFLNGRWTSGSAPLIKSLADDRPHNSACVQESTAPLSGGMVPRWCITKTTHLTGLGSQINDLNNAHTNAHKTAPPVTEWQTSCDMWMADWPCLYWE